jgi:hypothetical protein
MNCTNNNNFQTLPSYIFNHNTIYPYSKNTIFTDGAMNVQWTIEVIGLIHLK